MAWADNVGKREADEASFRHLAYELLVKRSATTPVRVLSLPGHDWQWEQQLERAFGGLRFQFSGVEQNPDVHARLSACTANMPERFSTTTDPIKVMEFLILNRRAEYDLIYYDWMGTWSKEKIAQVDSTLGMRMLSVGGILMMTVSIPRGQPAAVDALRKYPATLPCAFSDARSHNTFVEHPKVCGIPRWVADRAATHGMTLTPQMLEVYYSQSATSHHVTPQLRVTMRRDK